MELELPRPGLISSAEEVDLRVRRKVDMRAAPEVNVRVAAEVEKLIAAYLAGPDFRRLVDELQKSERHPGPKRHEQGDNDDKPASMKPTSPGKCPRLCSKWNCKAGLVAVVPAQRQVRLPAPHHLGRCVQKFHIGLLM
jgi:hypothetical protein